MLFYYQLGFLNFLYAFSDFLIVLLKLRGRFAFEIMEDKWLQREGAMEELLQKRRKGCQTLEEDYNLTYNKGMLGIKMSV